MATSLSGSYDQTLLRGCIWWDISGLRAHTSPGVQMCLTPSNWEFAPSNLLHGTHRFMAATLGSHVTCSPSCQQ